jgi:hypothetical protein
VMLKGNVKGLSWDKTCCTPGIPARLSWDLPDKLVFYVLSSKSLGLMPCCLR